MNEYPVAHLRIQGQDMIVIPLDSSFRFKNQNQQLEVLEALQICAIGAKIAGTVVLVWQDVSGVKFMAPPRWHSFFHNITFDWVRANLNGTLTCR